MMHVRSQKLASDASSNDSLRQSQQPFVRHLLIALILTAHYCLEVAICLPWTLGLRLFVRASAWWPLDWGLRFPPKLVALAGP